MEGLKQMQPLRKIQTPEVYEQIEKTIATLQSYYNNESPFTFTIDDPSGNSYIENYCLPNPDPALKSVQYRRTREQAEEMGLRYEDEPEEEFELKDQVHVFPGSCSRCYTECETRMHMIDIPHFKEVIIMSTACDECGYRSNEVKAGGAVATKGQRITLNMTDIEDLSRDILKVVLKLTIE